VSKLAIFDAPNKENARFCDIGKGIFRSRFIAGFEGIEGAWGRHCGAMAPVTVQGCTKEEVCPQCGQTFKVTRGYAVICL
jgi:hypothetical protein